MKMKKFKVTLSYEVVEYVDARDEDEAYDKIDHTQMNHDFIYGHGGGSYNVEEVED